MREGALLTVDYVFWIEDPPTYVRLTERLQKKGISLTLLWDKIG